MCTVGACDCCGYLPVHFTDIIQGDFFDLCIYEEIPKNKGLNAPLKPATR